MKNKIKWKRNLLTFLLVIALLCSSIVSVSAAQASQLKIEYDGNTKIISNIQGAVPARSRSIQNANLSTAVWNLLKEIGYTDEEIATLPEDLIAEYANAEKIYAVVEEKSFDDLAGIKPMSIIDKPLLCETSKVKVVFTVSDSGYINGRRAFTLNTVVNWKAAPVMTMKDIIAMAWSGNALSAGSAQSSSSMTYTRQLWSNGKCIETLNLSAPAKDMKEVNNFPNYAVEYDIPTDTVFPQYIYLNLCLRATTKVTATGDFIACSGYGHQVVKLSSPSVSLSLNGSAIGLEFGLGMDEFLPGTIRVYY